jgi:hypothetical protein
MDDTEIEEWCRLIKVGAGCMACLDHNPNTTSTSLCGANTHTQAHLRPQSLGACCLECSRGSLWETINISDREKSINAHDEEARLELVYKSTNNGMHYYSTTALHRQNIAHYCSKYKFMLYHSMLSSMLYIKTARGDNDTTT